MMHLRRIIATMALLSLCLWTVSANAQTIESSNEVFINEIFINTDPIQAEVYLKNDLIGITPLRLQNLEQGKVRLRIEKQGYDTMKAELSVSAEKRQQFFFNLMPEYVQIVLAQKNQDVYINEKRVGQTPLEVNNLPGGIYEIGRQENGIALSYKGFRDIRRMVRYETYFSAGMLLFSFAGRFYFEEKGNADMADSLEFSSLIFAGLLGYNLLKTAKLNSAAKEQLDQMTAIEVETFRADSARNYFEDGMELVGRENWKEALLKFNFLVNMFPDSEYTPIGIYEIGYCHYRTGEYEKASQNFRQSVYDYPLFELFGYALYYLLDSALKAGAVEEALADYEALRQLYVEDTSGELQKNYYDALINLYIKSGKKQDLLLADMSEILDSFLEKVTDASLYPDVYLLKGKLFYEHIDREEGIRILNDIKKRYNYDRNIMRELESILKNG
jgi:TolA-binding protein